MKGLKSRVWIGVVICTGVVSVACAFFVRYGYPWLSIGLGLLAFGVAVWVEMSSRRPTPRMSDVIENVEAESPWVPLAPVHHDEASRSAAL